jgi:hypothetical protein
VSLACLCQLICCDILLGSTSIVDNKGSDRRWGSRRSPHSSSACNENPQSIDSWDPILLFNDCSMLVPCAPPLNQVRREGPLRNLPMRSPLESQSALALLSNACMPTSPA